MYRTVESCVPPGFRFHPTDVELVGYYLRKKVASQKIDLEVIRDIDLYRIEPWDLQDTCRIGYEEQMDWYFFSHRDKKYPTGTRTNRATLTGFWKATGRDKAVYDGTKFIGMRKTLVFYRGRAPNGQKTDWIMHEYRMESEENVNPQEDGWVVCRAFKKRSTVQTKSTTIHGVESIEIPMEHHRANFLAQNLILKHEMEASEKHAHLMQTDAFPQLPELESPSLPPMKRPLHISHDMDISRNENTRGSKKMRDWRDLDKFVASQLSHGDQSSRDCELGLLMLQGDLQVAENDKSDIGICIFKK